MEPKNNKQTINDDRVALENFRIYEGDEFIPDEMANYLIKSYSDNYYLKCINSNTFQGNCICLEGNLTDNHSYLLWYFIKAPQNGFYRIKNISSKNVLNGWGRDSGKNSLTVSIDTDPVHTHRMWMFANSCYPGYFRIKNFNTGNVISRSINETGPSSLSVEIDDNFYSHLRLWTFIRLD